ncbi:MAG TPA: DMT family transporter [Trebonia sp.]|nr:DMT family transporter [Trebonia sp.]
MLTYLLAVLGACANATSSVLQRKAGQRVPQGENLSLRLIGSLLHQPVWFGGILAVTVGFLLQAAALGNGQLSVVEPILILELPFTLLLATRVFRSRLHRREWGAVIVMSAGVGGMFLLQSAMNAGRLVAAQPGLTLTDPIVSILWGVFVFHEQVRTRWYLVLMAAGGVVIVGAVAVLARSPLLSAESEEQEQPEEIKAGRLPGRGGVSWSGMTPSEILSLPHVAKPTPLYGVRRLARQNTVSTAALR